MARSRTHQQLLLVIITLLAGCGHAAASEVEALLQLKALALDSSSLQTWQRGSDPCGARADGTCGLGGCAWARVACDRHQVVQVDLSGLGLQGALPAGWEAPGSLLLLDLSNNKQLCGSLPAVQSPSTVLRTAGSSLGQPCSRAGPVAAGNPPGASPAAAAKPTAEAPSMSSMAKGLLGAGVGVGVLAGAAAGTLFFLRKKRESEEGLAGHDLARAHDSVVVIKQKKRARAAVPMPVLQAGGPAGEASTAAAAPGPSSSRHAADLRMVAFADGAGCAMSADDKQRLRAANIQDSVVFIRNKMASASGQLSSHKLGLDSSHGGSEHSWESSEQEQEGAGGAEPAVAAGASQEHSVLAEDAATAAAGGAPGAGQHEYHPEAQVEPHSALHSAAAGQQLQHSPSKRVQFGAVPAVVPHQ